MTSAVTIARYTKDDFYSITLNNNNIIDFNGRG